MSPRRAAAAAAFLLLAMGGPVSAASQEAAACPTLTDPTAPFYDLGDALGTDLRGLGTLVAMALPASLSQCLASFPGANYAAAIGVVDGTCYSVQPTFDNLAEIKALKAVVDGSGDNFSRVFDFIYEAKDDSYINLCKAISNPLTPCVRSSLPNLWNFLMSATESTSILNAGPRPCCVDFEASIKKNFGKPAGEGMVELYELLVNMVCSLRSPGFAGEGFQSCGYTLLHGLVDSPNGNEVLNLIKLLQIPNNQACAAYTGQPFIDTSGNKLEPINPDPKKSIDSCSIYMDNFVSTISKLPVLATAQAGNLTISDLFTSDKCLSWNGLIDEVILAVKKVAGPGLSDVVDAFLDQKKQMLAVIRQIMKCLHFPSGFSEQCDFKSTASTFLPPQSNKDPQQGETGKGPENNGSVFSEGFQAWMMMLLMHGAMMLF